MKRLLLQQRCLAHENREAVARCPSCGHFYCRECITEHDDRIICAACLKLAMPSEEVRKRRFGKAALPLQLTTGIGLLWFFFYLSGEALLRIPASWIDGSVWSAKASD